MMSAFLRRQGYKKMSKFIKGTLILIVASLITRVLGFINRIVVARFIGEEGVGLYMMALPTLFLVINITQLGLPVAISKFVAEANARGDEKKIKKILVVSIACTFSLSMIFTPLLLVLAPMLSEYIIYGQANALATTGYYAYYSNHRYFICHSGVFSRETKYETVRLFTSD